MQNIRINADAICLKFIMIHTAPYSLRNSNNHVRQKMSVFIRFVVGCVQI